MPNYFELAQSAISAAGAKATDVAKKSKKRTGKKQRTGKKERTGEGWKKFKGTMQQVFNAAKGGGGETPETAFSASYDRDFVVKAKRTRPQPKGMDIKKFIIPGIAIAAIALFALKKK